ncbi:MAG TPA: DHA2 family efflux MFS transporter permease subunit [Verrucomicrobiae bacterium]|jgi:DHA2 family multidrug resistance protein|nr:DHA2 family efflux MFS transporter permease subunit [Verrucomicrobiae bacterium]
MPQSGKVTNPWLIAVTVSLATFMEVMDTSIANIALRHIAGSVAASQSEATWVLTSYLVSNAIVVPISGWLASIMGRKRFYMSCVALFTVSSFACGIAPTLGILLLCRILQGIGGGGLAPSEQSILTDTFSAEQRGMAFAVYGVAVVVAPAIGPALGGWITDQFSWRWIFFINVPVGIISLIMTSMLVTDSATAKKEHEKATKGGIKVDYIGFAFVAIGLGSLQIVLDKGQEDDWFGSVFITTFAILALVGIIGGIIWELCITKNPIVDLPLFRDRGFLFTNIMMFATLFVLQSTTQLLPQFVQEILPYNATKAGLILMPGGFIIMALMPVVGFLVRKVQPKYLIAFGFIIIGFAMANLGGIETGVSFRVLAIARVFQAAGLAFLFVPINTLAYSRLPKGKSNNASALINLMRNLGGSVGISLATTLLARRSQTHQERLISNLTPTSLAFQTRLHFITQRLIAHGMDSVTASKQALANLYRVVNTQASMLSYLDIFAVLMFCSFFAAFLTLFLKRMDLSKAQTH